MNCLNCSSSTTIQLSRKTSLGYPVFRCSSCRRTFNERTDTPFNHLQFPSDIVMLVVLWRLRYNRYKGYTACGIWPRCSWCAGLPLHMKQYGIGRHGPRYAHAPLITEQLRSRRRGKGGRSWYADETYIKVSGKWCYLYRAIDRNGNLVDSMLSEHRDMDLAGYPLGAFFAGAKEVVGYKPTRVTTDGHDSYPRAIRRVLGRKVVHRTSRYLNNRIEQDHRGIKQRYYPMRGFGNFDSASRFCQAFDEQRDYFRCRTRSKEKVPLPEQRRLFRQRFGVLQYLLMTS